MTNIDATAGDTIRTVLMTLSTASPLRCGTLFSNSKLVDRRVLVK